MDIRFRITIFLRCDISVMVLSLFLGDACMYLEMEGHYVCTLVSNGLVKIKKQICIYKD